MATNIEKNYGYLLHVLAHADIQVDWYGVTGKPKGTPGRPEHTA